MHLVLTGISHKTAPVELRERLAVSGGSAGATIDELLSGLVGAVSLEECALVATCNRTEVYGLARHSDWQERLLGFLADFGGMSAPRLQPHLYTFDGTPAARHLFRVACGLDSLVIGEAQIQAQVKDALQKAQDAGTAGSVIDAFFRAALSTGKRAREETEITRGAVSVSLAAVELARQIFGRLNGHTALVLGAGEMGEQTARLLVDAGVDSRLLVCNRTFERAQSLAERYGGVAFAYDALPEALVRADIVISSTGAPRPILGRDLLRSVIRRRRGRPLFLIDIAVPRDVAPEVGELDDVFLYNIDDLSAVVDKNLAVRQSEVEKVDRIVEEELSRFQGWLQTRQVAPTIGALQRKLEAIGQSELERLGGKLGHLSARDREVVEALVRGVVSKILREPILHLRTTAVSGNGHESVDVLRTVFGLDEATECEVRSAKCEAEAEQPAAVGEPVSIHTVPSPENPRSDGGPVAATSHFALRTSHSPTRDRSRP